ncbi:MAG: hydantoinase/oxoprolinase family protein [Dehalococcoidia bacterium]|nr:hydantoinase/oxoprolinase family protein [Dehalococcoidia bacterium]
MPNWMVGIDTGGTFTDVAALEVGSHTLHVTKVPSTPDDPSRAVLNGLTTLMQEFPGITPGDIGFFAHGTTVATNALLEHKGVVAGLLTNRGFRAVYELRGGIRPMDADSIDTFWEKPAPLVRQRNIEEIDGRIAFDGSELDPLDEAGVREAVRRLKAKGVTAIAVVYLFSFMNPDHETRTARIIQEEFPGCRVSLSSLIFPVIREYHRISTTVVDAYVGPVIENYLRRLSTRLRELGLTTEQQFIMQSNGGLMRVDIAANYPNQTLLSGPAAGVVFGGQLGQAIGEPNVVTFDMGGTSTDIAVLVNGQHQESRDGKISHQDVGTPMIHINTLGAGGGTIAWIGPDGLLKAGPQSAGAMPGPACYGNGGEQAAVTDANLVLGYLEPSALVGGKVKLDAALSREAIRRKVAEPLGVSLEEAALGIVKVVNVNMEVDTRLTFAERGLDHRNFALVAFGGAGPVHATRVARNVGIPRVVVPPYPGISCAMGLLQTDVKHFYLRSHPSPLTVMPVDTINGLFRELEGRALDEAKLEGFSLDQVELLHQMDLRYPYQGYELTVSCQAPPFSEADKETVRRAFDQAHLQVYAISAPNEIPEVVNLRVVSVSKVPHLELPDIERGGPSAEAAKTGVRRARFEEFPDYIDTPVYRKDLLKQGNIIEGPAIIEQLDSTTVLLPQQRAEVVRYGAIIITVEA